MLEICLLSTLNAIWCFPLQWRLTYYSAQRRIAEKPISQGENMHKWCLHKKWPDFGLVPPEAHNCLHGAQIIQLSEGENTRRLKSL